jgi:hypothetical protein
LLFCTPHVHQHHRQIINRSIAQSVNLADTTGDSGAGSTPAGAVDGAGTKATLGESRPDLAGVGATSESTVSIDDGVTGLDEVGVAGLAVWELVFCSITDLGVCGYLQGHAVDDELHGEVLSIGGDAVANGRASSVVLAELVDQVPHDCDCVSMPLLVFMWSCEILPS